MTDHDDYSTPRPCGSFDVNGPCQSFWPGHNLHYLHARRLRSGTRGWTSVAVVSVEGNWAKVRFADDTRADVWKHYSWDGLLRPGALIDFSADLNAIRLNRRAFNVFISNGGAIRANGGDLDSPIAESSRSRRFAFDPGNSLASGGGLRPVHDARVVLLGTEQAHTFGATCDLCGWFSESEYRSQGSAALAATTHSLDANAEMPGPYDNGLGLIRPLTDDQRRRLKQQRDRWAAGPGD